MEQEQSQTKQTKIQYTMTISTQMATHLDEITVSTDGLSKIEIGRNEPVCQSTAVTNLPDDVQVEWIYLDEHTAKPPGHHYVTITRGGLFYDTDPIDQPLTPTQQNWCQLPIAASLHELAVYKQPDGSWTFPPRGLFCQENAFFTVDCHRTRNMRRLTTRTADEIDTITSNPSYMASTIIANQNRFADYPQNQNMKVVLTVEII